MMTQPPPRPLPPPPRHFPSSAGVIVYLTQGARHSSYGQSTAEQLKKSVGLLYEHYNAAQRDDVVFLHTGDVGAEMQADVLSVCGPEARFYQLPKRHFELPDGVDPKSKQWLFPNKFSAGYRHMIRFFTVGIWEVAEDLGYQFVMRLDDDAYVLSPIPYNIFARMAERKLEYGFRLTSYEHGEPAQRGDFHAFVRNYALQRGINPRWGLQQSCPDNDLRRFTPERCGQVYTIYNNFFVSNVSFWRRPDVRAFISHIDASKTIYYNRWGDALWHSVALMLFMPRERVHMFDDFTYEHTSRKIHFYRNKPTVCFQWGGIAIAKTMDGKPPPPMVVGRARALTSINMCSRSRGDVNRCFFAHKKSGVLLGVFAGTVTPESPDVLSSYCNRLRAEWEDLPLAFCRGNGTAGAAALKQRAYTCEPRRKLLNTTVELLFPHYTAGNNRTFRQTPTWVDGKLKSAVRGYQGGTPRDGHSTAANAGVASRVSKTKNGKKKAAGNKLKKAAGEMIAGKGAARHYKAMGLQGGSLKRARRQAVYKNLDMLDSLSMHKNPARLAMAELDKLKGGINESSYQKIVNLLMQTSKTIETLWNETRG